MRKILISFLVIMLAFSIVGCGAKGKMEDKLTEKIIKQTTGMDADISGDKITFKGQDGEELTIGSSTWPTSKLAKSIPEFKKGKVTAVMESPDAAVITLELVLKEDVYPYFETIKKEFAQDAAELNTEEMRSFNGKNEAGINVTLVYISEVLTITVSSSQQ